MKEYNKNTEKKRISQNRSFVNLTVDKYLFCDWKSIDISHETSKTGSGIRNPVYNFVQKERQEKL